MTSHSLLAEPRTVCAFDLETRLDASAAAVAGYKGNGLPSALQMIGTACCLSATEMPDGTWTDVSIRTFADPLTEFDVLMALDEEFERLAQRNAMLLTYNGRGHDLAILRRRAARHWMFGLPGIVAATAMDHVDLMLHQRLGRRDAVPSLRDACAALGISTLDARRSAPGLGPDVRKCQIDVASTFLLALYEMAIERGSPDVIVGGWRALSEYLTRQKPRLLHLEHFRSHATLRAALNTVR